jgi:excisionase family DNA binding protein
MELTLGQAAKVTGLGKTTLTRAIKRGHLSATRREDGSYAIDPSELSRVYKVTPETVETVTATGYAAHRVTLMARPTRLRATLTSILCSPSPRPSCAT